MSEWWHAKALAELDSVEWEALCDGCAKCCLHKLEDEYSGKLFYTRIRCSFLNESTCRCSDYNNRAQLEPDCIQLHQDSVPDLYWLPATCAYRLRANGERLPQWHYLVCGDREAVHNAGESIRGRTVSANNVHPDGYDEHVVHWVNGE